MRRYRKKRIKTNFLKNIRRSLRTIRRNTVKFFRRRTKKKFSQRLRATYKKKRKKKQANLRLYITKTKVKKKVKKKRSNYWQKSKVLKPKVKKRQKLRIRKRVFVKKWFTKKKKFKIKAKNQQKEPVEPIQQKELIKPIQQPVKLIQQQQLSPRPKTREELKAFANNSQNIKHQLQQEDKKNSNKLINNRIKQRNLIALHVNNIKKNSLTALREKKKYKARKLRKKKNKRLRLKKKIAIRKLFNLHDKITKILLKNIERPRKNKLQKKNKQKVLPITIPIAKSKLNLVQLQKIKKPQRNNVHKRKIKHKIRDISKSELNFAIENPKFALENRKIAQILDIYGQK